MNGNVLVCRWENLLDLSRNVYSENYHSILHAGDNRRGTPLTMIHIFRGSWRWTVTVTIVTFVLAAVFSVTSTVFLNGLSWGIGLCLLFVIVLIGVVFDAIGIAAAAADEKPFHSMASKKVPGARQAVGIIRKADQFSNFCNDVIGDISGIVSGAVAFAVVTQMVLVMQNPTSAIQAGINVLLTAIVAAVTVGGKALGKSVAISHANDIVFYVAKVFYVLETRFRITFFDVRREKHKRRDRKREIKQCYWKKSTHLNS